MPMERCPGRLLYLHIIVTAGSSTTLLMSPQAARFRLFLLTAAEKPFPYDTMAYAVLQVHSSESRFKMGSFSSRTSMCYVLDCLYGILFSLDYEQNMDNLVKFAHCKVERSYFYSGLGRGDSTD